MRSTLHDLTNVLAGVKGILDLNQPGQPLSQRDRDRLEAVVQEGVTTLERCRNLALATLPDRFMEPGPAWRQRLLDVLGPVGTLFRCQFQVVFEGSPEWDQWPGDLLRGYAQAVTRQVMPYARTTVLTITCRAARDHWLLSWRPAAALPDSLGPEAADRTGDICSSWALRAGCGLGAALSWSDGALLARVPRPAPA